MRCISVRWFLPRTSHTPSPHDRCGFFQATLERLFCPPQALPRYPSWQPFQGLIEASVPGSVRLAKVASAACGVRRRPEDNGRLSEAAYLIKFQTKGGGVVLAAQPRGAPAAGKVRGVLGRRALSA